MVYDGGNNGSNWFSQYAKNITSTLPGINQAGNGLGTITRPILGMNYEQMPATGPGGPQGQLPVGANGGMFGAQAGAPGAIGGGDPVQQMLMQLMQAIQANQPKTMSAQDILSQATHQVSATYDPQISAIQREMTRTKGRAGKSKAELNHLYSSLSDSYAPEAAASKRQYDNATKAAKSQQADLQAGLSKDYAANLNQQADQFGNLGIGAAMGQTSQHQKDDLNYLSKLNATEGSSQLQALQQQGNADQTYSREGAGIARTEGANAVTDLMTQLNSYLNTKGGDVATLQGQRASQLKVLQDQLTNQSTKATQDYNQTAWGQLFQMMGFQNTLQQQQAAAAAAQQKQQTVPTTGLSGANQIFAEYFGNTQQAKDMSGRFQELLQQKEFRTGKFKDGGPTPVNITAPQAAQYAAQFADKNQLSELEKLSLINAVYSYYGKM